MYLTNQHSRTSRCNRYRVCEWFPYIHLNFLAAAVIYGIPCGIAGLMMSKCVFKSSTGCKRWYMVKGMKTGDFWASKLLTLVCKCSQILGWQSRAPELFRVKLLALFSCRQGGAHLCWIGRGLPIRTVAGQSMCLWARIPWKNGWFGQWHSWKSRGHPVYNVCPQLRWIWLG